MQHTPSLMETLKSKSIVILFLIAIFAIAIWVFAIHPSQGNGLEAPEEDQAQPPATNERAIKTANGSLEDAKIYFGRIDVKFALWLIDNPQIDDLILISGGGQSDIALNSAKVLNAMGTQIYLPSLCASACSEFFLYAPNTPKTTANTMIGYHWDTFAQRDAWANASKRAEPYCFDKHYDEAKMFYERYDVPFDGWKRTFEKLGQIETQFKVFEEIQCSAVKFQTEIELWFPSSHQLETIFGFKTSGPICADSEECARNHIYKRYPKGVKYAVGEDWVIEGGR